MDPPLLGPLSEEELEEILQCLPPDNFSLDAMVDQLLSEVENLEGLLPPPSEFQDGYISPSIFLSESEGGYGMMERGQESGGDLNGSIADLVFDGQKSSQNDSDSDVDSTGKTKINL